MPRLILMRHAKSSWSHPDLNDFERPLNARGRASATAMGQWLRDRGFVPDEVLCSSAERTGETFLRLGLDTPVSYSRSLYHASAQRIQDAVRRATGRVVLMIGHNPGIGEFAERLVKQPPQHPRFLDYPTCATLVADMECAWSEVCWDSGRVVDFTIPREVIGSEKGV